jgi:hypothetical protein
MLLVKDKTKMTKKFTIAGVSTFEGTTKFRFANGTVEARTKVLERGGHTAIHLYELPSAVSKDAARDWLQENHPTVIRTAKKAEKAKTATTTVAA